MESKCKKSAALKYFTKTEDNNYYICIIETNGKKCNGKLTAKTGKEHLGRNAPTRTNNLKRHLQRYHAEIFKTVDEADSVNVKNKQKSEGKPKAQGSIVKYFEPQKVTVCMTQKIFRQSIIDMIVKSGISLSFFSSEAFLNLNGEMAQKMEISLERHNVRDMVVNEAKTQKENLKSILKGKYVFLKMDACTRQRTNYFAVNVQFLNYNHEITVRTLSVKDTKAMHDSSFICDLVEQVIKEYEIDKKQILAVVTDNASNMIKAVEKLNEREVSEDLEEQYHTNEQEENSEVDEIFEMNISRVANVSSIRHMRCAVHTLQLAINDGLKEKYISNVVSRIRQIVIAARAPKVDSVLKRRAGKGAVIDQATRWGSTYLMIQRLLELKHILEDMANPNVTMTEHQWEEVMGLEHILKFPYVVTKRLQETSLTPGIFYKEWRNLTYKLGQTGGMFAESIKFSMERREKTLMNNDVLLSAIFVDPKYRILLNEEQLQRAREALCEIAIQMRGIEESTDNVHAEVPQLSSHSDSGTDDSDFEKRLDIKEKTKRRRIESSSDCCEKGPMTYIEKFKIEFSDALSKIEKIDRTSKIGVKEAIPIYPEIAQDVAWVLTALPTTQVSVERLFSGLRFIKSDLRASMKEDLVEAILFLRTNSV